MLNEKKVEFKSRFRSWFELNCLDFLDMTGGHTIKNEWNRMESNAGTDRPQKPKSSREKYRVIRNLGQILKLSFSQSDELEIIINLKTFLKKHCH